MRPIDANELYARLMARYTAHNLDDTRDMAARAAIMSCMEAVERSKTITATPPPNDPLTLEELREMDGEPVYITSSRDGGYLWGWAIVSVYKELGRETEITFVSNHATLSVNEYGRKNGLTAYRRKPEGDDRPLIWDKNDETRDEDDETV